MTRRTFGRRIAAAALVPIAAPGLRAGTTQDSPLQIAGYTPTAEEREAMERFLADQEKGLAPLRAQALPNDLAPAVSFHPSAPRTTRRP